MATEETVSTIAKALGESDEVPMGQIAGVVKALGEELTLKLLDETRDIESKGGMMLPDNSRKRSIGGVFFFLARQKLSHDDKLAIFRAPKSAKPPSSATASDSTRFPRRRVIDVAPARPAAPAARAPRPGFLPPELPVAVRRVKVREALQTSLSSLPKEDQYGVLLDLIADLHDQLGYRVPESQRLTGVFDPPTRPGVTLSGPPSSQRPIPVPESTRTPESARQPTGAPPAVEATPEKPKRTAVRAKRS
jgi:hypothetical protein